MTTFEHATLSLTRGLIARIEARARRRAEHATRTATKVAPGLARSILTLAALAAFTIAASTFAVWTGLLVGGVCALYLAQAVGDD